MVSWRNVLRLMAAAAFALTGLVGVDSSPAAAIVNVVVVPVTDCTGNSYPRVSANNTEIFRISLTGSSCAHVQFNNVTGAAATATADSTPLVDGTLTPVNSGAVIDVVAPATGFGSVAVDLFTAANTSSPSRSITLCFGDDGIVSGALVDNSDGSVTFTYAGDNGNCQNNFVNVYPAGTQCPTSGPPAPSRIGVLVSPAVNPQGTLAASPALLAGGTVVVVPGSQFTTTALVAGTTYVLCYYQYDLTATTLAQQISVTLQNVAPPTPPTSPVAPAYTG